MDNQQSLEMSLVPFTKTMKAIKNLQNVLKCKICEKQPISPIAMGRCDHFFCEPCLSKSSNNCCPLCKISSLPCERNSDNIVCSLVSSCADLITLFNGGKIVKKPQGFEAPDSACPFSSSKSDKQDLVRSETKEDNSSYKFTGKSSTLRASSKNMVSSKSLSKVASLSSSNSTNRPKGGSLKNSFRNRKNASTSSVHPKIQVNISKCEDSNSSLVTNKLDFPATPRNKSCPKVQELKTPVTPAVNKRNNKGETLLHSACIKGDLCKAKDLLSEGANPNTKDNAGWTPLHEACSHGFVDIAILLLEHGALIDVPGNDNGTPLHDAVTAGVVELICVLRKWGASDEIRDLYGRTPRSIANECKSPLALHEALNSERDESLKLTKVMDPIQNKIVLTESNLSLDYKQKFETVAKLLKAKHNNEFSTDVTHVIVGCSDGTKQCQRSIKYLMGLASGCWILSHKWLDECLSIGGPTNPEEYEVAGSRSCPHSNAPSKGRKNTFKMNPGLFSGCHMYLLGNFAGSYFNKKEVESLIRAGGGITLQREPNPESIDEKEKTVPFHADPKGPLAICSHYCIYLEGINEPQLKYDMAHIKSLPISWLLNSIDNWSLLTPSK